MYAADRQQLASLRTYFANRQCLQSAQWAHSAATWPLQPREGRSTPAGVEVRTVSRTGTQEMGLYVRRTNTKRTPTLGTGLRTVVVNRLWMRKNKKVKEYIEVV